MRPVVLLGLTGCLPDDWNGEPYLGPPTSTVGTDTAVDTGTVPGGPALVGSWISEGDDLSPLFAAAPFSYVRVESTFRSDATYRTTTVGEDGPVELSGTWSTDETTSPATVAVEQVLPYVASALGIWQVDGERLTWEVVQIVPDYGYVAPTPESGFGSTSGPGLVTGANVQIYRRSP